MQVDDTTPHRSSIADNDNDNVDEVTTALVDEERGIASSGHPTASRTSRGNYQGLEGRTEHYTRRDPASESHSDGDLTPNVGGRGNGNYIKRKTSQILDAFSSSSTRAETPLSPLLAQLVQTYASSQIAADLRAEINQNGESDPAAPGTESRDVVEENVNIRGRRRASYATQFRILSGRAFKNLYRNPALLGAHYVSSIFIACAFVDCLLLSQCSRG